MCVEENRLETNTSGFRFHVDARDRFSRSACVSLQWKKTALLSPSPPVSRHGMRHSLAWCTPRHTTPHHATPRRTTPRRTTPRHSSLPRRAVTKLTHNRNSRISAVFRSDRTAAADLCTLYT